MFKALIFLAIASLGVAYALWDQVRPPPITSKVQISKGLENIIEVSSPAPEVAFITLDGQEITLLDFAGKTVLVNFWATWCAPCVVEFPALIELAESRKDMVLLAVSVDENAQEIQRFLKKYNLTLPSNFILTHDPEKKIANDAFQTFKFPETYVIDGDLQIRHKVEGIIDWLDPEAQKALGL